MLDEAVRIPLGRSREPDIGDRFDLATAEAHMRRAFGNVELREWRGVLTIPTIDDAMQLFASYGPDGIVGDELDAVREAYRGIAERRLASSPLAVTRHDGAFVATV